LTKTHTVAGGKGGSDSIALDAFYIPDFYDGLLDPTPPAVFIQSQDPENSLSAQADAADQFKQIGNSESLVPLPKASTVSITLTDVIDDVSPVHPFDLQSFAAASENQVLTDSFVAAGGPSPWSSPAPAHTEVPDLFSQATAAVETVNDFFPFASAASGGLTQSGASKPVASIPQLADYLMNGFWQFSGEIAHHWASSTISYPAVLILAKPEAGH